MFLSRIFLTVEVQLLAVWRQALPPCCVRLSGEGAVQEQGRKETWQWPQKYVSVSGVESVGYKNGLGRSE